MEGQIEFPRQRLTRAAKTESWKKQCIDAVISSGVANASYRRNSEHNKRRNYRLFNNKIDIKDFEHVTNPWGINTSPGQFTFPATLQPYDVVSPIFSLLQGEEAKRIFNPIVRAINEDSISQKEKEKHALIMRNLEQLLMSNISPEEAQSPDFQTPEELQKYMTYTYQELRERIGNDLLQYYRKYLDLTQVFQEGWKDALIAGEEIYCIEIVGGEPKIRRVNPLSFYCYFTSQSDYIDSAERICEKSRMSLSEILDNWYDYLAPSDIDKLEEMGSSSTITFGQITIPVVESIYSLIDENGSQNGHDVFRVKWKSMRKIGTLHYLDPQTGEPQEMVVDEEFKIDKSDPTQWIEWMWINEYWEGIRINNDIYLNIRPCQHQFRSMMNMSECKSGYVGTVYNATNAQSVSLMDRLVPWIYLLLITWYRTELLMATNMGKIGLIDLSLVPDNWEIEKWLYYANAMKIGFVNSFNEGKKGERTGILSQSTQNKELDLDTGASIQRHVEILQLIEQKLYDTSGITRQRMGAISTSELVGNVERAVIQSSHVTEEMFRVHNNVKTRVLTALIEVAKEAYLGMTKKMQYVTDDMATVFFTLEGDEFANADYGVFVSDSTKDNEALQAVKQLMQTALQSDKIQMSQVLDVYTTDSIADTKNRLKRAEMEQQQAEQQQAQQSNEIQREMIAREDFNREADRRTKIQVATISALGFSEEKDANQNNEPDVIEQEKLALKQREQEFKENQAMMQNEQDRKREDRENKKLKADVALKKEKLSIDRKKASQKPKSTKK